MKQNMSVRVASVCSKTFYVVQCYSHSMCTITIHGRYLIDLVATHVARLTTSSGSDILQICDSVQEDGSRLRFSAGLGQTHVLFEGHELVFACQQHGEPVAPHCANDTPTLVHQAVTLKGPSREVIQKFCDAAHKADETNTEGRFPTYTWDAKNEHWRRQSLVRRRPMESIILNGVTTTQLIHDVEEFVCTETREWYERHGVPYRRGYLFYGPPGTGKTSTIAGIASHLNRSVCRINLVAPGLSDDSLQTAITNVRDDAILVMEDIDCLFGTMREKLEGFHVTFSGLLNAIDGLQDNSRGLIFCFTSNHRDKLDAALRRKGRIDMELSFDTCSNDQVERMFLRFYPNADQTLAQTFSVNVSKVLRGETPSPAMLQEYFVRCRKSDANDAAKQVSFDAQIPDNVGHMWS